MKGLFAALAGLALLPSAMAFAQSGTLVAYTAHESTVASEMAPRFERETGYTLRVVRLSSGAAMDRLIAEADEPRCDVVWSVSGEGLEANAPLLEAYIPRDWAAVAPQFKAGTNWLPYTCVVNVIVVNTRLLPSDLIPRSWAELAEAKWRGRICSATPDRSGSAYMQMNNVLLAFPRGGGDVYRRIVDNFFVSSSSDAVSKYVNDGEAPIGITLEDNAYRYAAGGGPVRIVYPSEGVIAAADGIALVKGAPHPQAAKAFIDWCLSSATQRFLVERMYRRPVRLDCGNPPGLPRLEQLTVLPYDFDQAAKGMHARLQLFAEMMEKAALTPEAASP